MTEFSLLQLVNDTINLALLLSAPVLIIGTTVGVLVSIFQTATSIQDQSLSFIPKLLATAVSIKIFGPWMLSIMMQFTTKILGTLNTFAR